MNFTLPTTKTEMYTTLQEIFNFYRQNRQASINLSLQPLSLTRLSYTPKSDAQLLTIAEQALSSKHLKEKQERIADLNEKITESNAKIASATAKYNDAVQKINTYYDGIAVKLEQQAVKNGTYNSTVLTTKLAEIETERATKLTEASAEKTSVVTAENTKISSYEELIEDNDDYFEDIHTAEIYAKLDELKEDRDKLTREVFRYNNSLDEKEQRNENVRKQEAAELQVKILQINNIEYTKDQLIDMGYYEDVIRCVCGYFDRLSTLEALRQITSENKLVVYLESYYEQIVYLYQSRM